jgi:hypothetical protein
VGWIYLAKGRVHWRTSLNPVMNGKGNFDYLSDR